MVKKSAKISDQMSAKWEYCMKRTASHIHARDRPPPRSLALSPTDAKQINHLHYWMCSWFQTLLCVCTKPVEQRKNVSLNSTFIHFFWNRFAFRGGIHIFTDKKIPEAINLHSGQRKKIFWMKCEAVLWRHSYCLLMEKNGAKSCIFFCTTAKENVWSWWP